jgi:hypothetical protein
MADCERNKCISKQKMIIIFGGMRMMCEAQIVEGMSRAKIGVANGRTDIADDISRDSGTRI